MTGNHYYLLSRKHELYAISILISNNTMVVHNYKQIIPNYYELISDVLQLYFKWIILYLSNYLKGQS